MIQSTALESRADRRVQVAQLLDALTDRVLAFGGGARRLWFRRGALIERHRPLAWLLAEEAETELGIRCRAFVDGRATLDALRVAVRHVEDTWHGLAALAADLELPRAPQRARPDGSAA